MTRTVPRVLTTLLLATLFVPTSVFAQASDCSGYDSQIWAQSVFARDPNRYAALDPDGNGFACDDLPPGAAPAWWTKEIPEEAAPAQLVGVVDGDTIQANLDGQVEAVELFLIDSPESDDATSPPECYGTQASSFLTWLLSLSDTLYLESDVSDRDERGGLPRHVWLDFGDGEVYLVNEVMIRSGHAAPSTAQPDGKYDEEVREAARFAREHEYGLWSGCVTDGEGDTQELSDSGPVVPRPETAPGDEGSEQAELTPQQVVIHDPPEAFGCDAAPAEPCVPGETSDPDGVPLSEGPETEAPGQAERPAGPILVGDPAEAFGCDPSYPDICIPPGVADLECTHIYDQGLSQITVYPPDPHGFDEDFDGVGCEGG